MSKALSEIISHADRNINKTPILKTSIYFPQNSAATRSVQGVAGTQKEELETELETLVTSWGWFYKKESFSLLIQI